MKYAIFNTEAKAKKFARIVALMTKPVRNSKDVILYRWGIHKHPILDKWAAEYVGEFEITVNSKFEAQKIVDIFVPDDDGTKLQLLKNHIQTNGFIKMQTIFNHTTINLTLLTGAEMVIDGWDTPSN